MNILEKIKTLKNDRNWSYYNLSYESGITQSTLANMFSRGTMPSLKTLIALCDAFGITLAEFFSDTAETARTFEEGELISYYRNLTTKQKYYLREFLKTFCKY